MPAEKPSVKAYNQVLRWVALIPIGVAYVFIAAFSTLFGMRMLTDYVFAPWAGESWVQILPQPAFVNGGAPTAGIYAHWCGGVVVLALGLIQPLSPVRRRWPAVHRACGNVYIAASVVTCCGGLLFLLTTPDLCVGGWNMHIAFALYGLVFLTFALLTWTHARARRVREHRDWAIRLWAQGAASMGYRLWYLFLGLAGYPIDSVDDFHRPLDEALDWMFFVLNALVAELVIWLLHRRDRATAGAPLEEEEPDAVHVKTVTVAMPEQGASEPDNDHPRARDEEALDMELAQMPLRAGAMGAAKESSDDSKWAAPAAAASAPPPDRVTMTFYFKKKAL